MATSQTTTGELRARYREVRTLTEALAAPLSAEDQVVQSMPDTSPTKWHRAHTSWFFETFLLGEHLDGHEPFDPDFGFLFNSYYEAVGPRHSRPHRGMITRPDSARVGEYRQAVDQAMLALLDAAAASPDAPQIFDLVELGLHHEQQHQELLLMDCLHLLSRNPTHPVYCPRPDRAVSEPTPLGWVAVDGGIHGIGHEGPGFAFDNESPRHDVLLAPFELADRLVTCGEWLAFMDDGGYQRAELWLSDGWAAVQEEEWDAPLYWSSEGDTWQVFTLHGRRPVEPGEPVAHVSHYEADAYARWAGARLPLEAEWEVASAGQPVSGNFVDSGRLHPEGAGASSGQLRQLFGDLWEWTASPYSAYPGFVPEPGAVGEYNGKFMINQMVLRGGCCATPAGHIRPTYRNFFPPHARWMFSGVRLARSTSSE